MGAECCQKTLGFFLHYETLKIVDIKNKKVGALYRLIQLIILSYVIGFVIVYKKGYQEKDTAISTVSTKLKGTAFVDFKNFSQLFNGITVYDPADYVVPPQESDGFFVMTNMIITPNQTQGKCPEDPRFKDNQCQSDKDCQPPLGVVKNGNGIRTGACVPTDHPSFHSPHVKVCEIYGWCPTEHDVLPMPHLNFTKYVPLLGLAKDFTVLVKNQVSLPQFHIQMRNIFNRNDQNFLKGCIYSKQNDSLCPVFKLGHIVDYCGDNFTEVAYKGATYGIIINWDCDFDHPQSHCLPTYDFRRLDDPNVPISPGYNFRFSEYYVEKNKRYRTLTKAYGIKFQVMVYGRAGKFSPVPLFLNLGAGLALLGIATIWCDFIVLYLLKKRKKYKAHKFERIDDDSSESSVDEVDNNEKQLVQREVISSRYVLE